ncbi:ATP-binding protein [Aquisalibacillus elongatus]|uniref:AAA domain-containing protein n=1 Tax=Aquisalibacillus elongatus TaxID=485577 RepID=A0A3N5BCS9_9BACI|nr:ATP-binding protein [Aquisalibacillus elongatus]RPF55273.1 AAA domain-containing protein [Aquisalibacillus elongatus]
MDRKVIITVGKTHSGKTTFAKALEQELDHSLIIDQDNHAEFINTYYEKLLPEQGPNTFKYTITQTILEYAVKQTDYHLIICNSNLNKNGRLNLINYLKEQGFTSILVYFDIPEQTLRDRISNSNRSKAIFRTASNFDEVLDRQLDESDGTGPNDNEADFLFKIKQSEDLSNVIQSIIK